MVKLYLHLKHTVQAAFYKENSIQFCKIFWHFKLLGLKDNILTSFGPFVSGGTCLVLHLWRPCSASIYSRIDTTAAWKKLRFISSAWSYFHMTDSLSKAAHAFASRALISVSVDETLLSISVNLSTSFRELPFSVEMSPV